MRLIPLGAACNNACVFCAQGALRDLVDAPPVTMGPQAAPNPGALQAPDVTRQIAAIVPGEIVAFVGGEPTIWDALPAWIRAADAREPQAILVQTNGRRLAYRAFARALREASPRLALDVSLHGSTAPMHDYHTGTPQSFDQTLLGLRSARAERIPVGITTVVTRSNFRHLAEIVRVAHAAGARAVHFAQAEVFGRAAVSRDRVIPAPELVAPHLSRAVAEAGRLRLGVLAGEVASGPEIAQQFAGIGEVERDTERGTGGSATATATATATVTGERRVRLAVLGRPVPAKAEVRGTVRRTGAELAEIFPALFEDRKAGGID